MKKIILATLISGIMSASALAESGSGTVTFTGSIIDAPCSIAPGEENREIPMGQVSNVTLDNGNESSAQPVLIKLEGCNLSNNNEVEITFKGTEAGSSTGYLQITGTASGAAIKLMNASGTQVNVNEAVKQNYVEGNNTLKFQASLIGLQLKDANDDLIPVTPGQFQAVTNFSLAYY
ncbi:fimbrial protein [Providencia rettgeri]|uniref:fimbrial protein n=1 Tax=Providencia rettgeri TaxID=587 RepID=UPI003525FBF8